MPHHRAFLCRYEAQEWGVLEENAPGYHELIPAFELHLEFHEGAHLADAEFEPSHEVDPEVGVGGAYRYGCGGLGRCVGDVEPPANVRLELR